MALFSTLKSKEALFLKLKKQVPTLMLALKKLFGSDKESRNASKSFMIESITAVESEVAKRESSLVCWAWARPQDKTPKEKIITVTICFIRLLEYLLRMPGLNRPGI